MGKNSTKKDDAYYNHLADQCRNFTAQEDVDQHFMEYLYEDTNDFIKGISVPKHQYIGSEDIAQEAIINILKGLRKGQFLSTEGNSYWAWVRIIYRNTGNRVFKKVKQTHTTQKNIRETSPNDGEGITPFLENCAESVSIWESLSPSEFMEFFTLLRDEMDDFKQWFSRKKRRSNFFPAEVWIQLRRVVLKLIPSLEHYTNRSADTAAVPNLVPWHSDEEKWTFAKEWPEIAQIWNKMAADFLPYLIDKDSGPDHPTTFDLDDLLREMMNYTGPNWNNSRSAHRTRTRQVIMDYTETDSPSHTLLYKIFVAPNGKEF